MKKKIAAAAAIALMTSLLAGCGGNSGAASAGAVSGSAAAGSSGAAAGSVSESSSSSDKSAARTYGLIIGDSTQDFHNIGQMGFEGGLRENEKLVTLACQQDISKQYDQISDLINQHVDAIILVTIDADAMLSGIQLAVDAGIPVFIYDQPLTEEGLKLIEGEVFISDYTIGFEGGKAMAEGLKEKNGEYKGKVMTYAASYTTAGASRLEGFYDALKEYPEIECFHNADDDWDTETALGVIESVYLANQDMDGFWAWCELPTIAAVQVFQENDVLDQMVITTNECSKTMYDYIDQGFIYAGTELNPLGLGEDAVSMVHAYFDGDPIEKETEHKIFNVTKDNLDEAVTPFVEVRSAASEN